MAGKDIIMTDLSFYENVLPSPNKKKNLIIKIAAIAAYAIITLLWILSAFINKHNGALIIVVIFLLSAALWIILRIFNVEFEYSVSDSEITLAKIYGKSRRKEIFSADSDSILLIAPETEENIKKAEAYQPRNSYRMSSPNTDKKVWIVVFEDEDEEKTLFVFEAEDYVTKILKQLKPSVISFR